MNEHSGEGPRVERIASESQSGAVIPCFVDGQEWAACFGLSWADMLLWDQAGPQRMIRPGGQFVRKVAGTMGVAAARSEMAAHFLANTDAEWLFMVDTDMGFGPDTVDRLVASAVANDVQVLGALCFAQKIDPDMPMGAYQAARYRICPTIYDFAERTNGEQGFMPRMRYAREAYSEVGATGAACMLVHRDVLTKVGADPFAPLAIPGAGGQGTSRTFSEDLSFCVRVRAEGFTIGVDTAIKTTHYKGGLFLDETTYAMQQETLIQAKGHEIARRTETYLRHGLYVPNGVRG